MALFGTVWHCLALKWPSFGRTDLTFSKTGPKFSKTGPKRVHSGVHLATLRHFDSKLCREVKKALLIPCERRREKRKSEKIKR